MTPSERINEILASGLYAGKIPFAPGTFGTLAGLVPVYFLSLVSPLASLVILVLAVPVSIIVAHQAEKTFGTKDPGWIVIDEVVGIMAALWGLSFAPVPVAAGFLVFRLLDIAKPFPIKYLDQKLPGGAGIVADDLAAGIMTNLVLRLAAGLM